MCVVVGGSYLHHGGEAQQEEDMVLTQQLRARGVKMESDTGTDSLVLRERNKRENHTMKGLNTFSAGFQVNSRQKAG